MPVIRYILSEYVERVMAQTVYDKLEDGTFAGKIPPCKGVIAFGNTLRECEDELHSVLEDWILVGLKLGHPLPQNPSSGNPFYYRIFHPSTSHDDSQITCRKGYRSNSPGFLFHQER